jgi:hypothetical protein
MAARATMNSQRIFAIPAAILALALFAPLAHGQGRGMRGSAGGFRPSSSFRANRGGNFDRQGGRRFENGFGFPFAPFFYADDYLGSDADYSDFAAGARPTQARVMQPPAPVPPPPPGDTLILENHDGQWVRIPTGAEMAKVAASSNVEGLSGSSSQTASASASQTAKAEAQFADAASPALPPAVLVFRDGHSEEVQKYVIQGGDLYATAAYSATGSWTKKISLTDLDIPASLKINKERGTKFNLPSGPNEVLIRF